MENKKVAGDTVIYNEVNDRFKQIHKSDFVQAASNHLAEAMKLFSDLPWVT